MSCVVVQSVVGLHSKFSSCAVVRVYGCTLERLKECRFARPGHQEQLRQDAEEHSCGCTQGKLYVELYREVCRCTVRCRGVQVYSVGYNHELCSCTVSCGLAQ